MANALKTVVTYQLDGQTVDFTIPFDYLARKFVKLTLLGKDRKELALNTDYRFATRKTISLTNAWGGGDGYNQLEMRRYTSATERLVDFTDGSILRAYDLNVAQLQTMHIAEEARDLTADTIGVNNDGDLDARGHRIINLADAHEDGDAVSLGTLKGFSNNAWQARNEAEGFRNEAEKFQQLAAAEVSKAAGEVGKAAEEAGKAKLQAGNAASEASRATAEADRSAAQVDKAKQWADKASAEVGKVQQEVGEVNEAIEKAKEQVSLAEASSVKVQQMAEQVKEDARDADESAKQAKYEADRAKEEADKVEATNQISATLESVTPTAVTFNREVAARSHLRCMTPGGIAPLTGVHRSGAAELYMTVDADGNTGFTASEPSGSPQFRAYWNSAGTTYVSTSSMNLDQGSRQIKGSLEVGQGSNSAIHTVSKGDSSNGSFVNYTKWKWHDGGVEVGAERGDGRECVGLMRTTSGGKSVTYQQDAEDGSHKFLNNKGEVVVTIKPDGTIETAAGGSPGGPGPGGGGGATEGGLKDRSPKRWSPQFVGGLVPRLRDSATLKFDVRGLRALCQFQDRRQGLNIVFTFPPTDGRFQFWRLGDWMVFELSNNGTRLSLEYGDTGGNEPFEFYVEDPEA